MDLVDHLQGKLSTRLETTDSSAPLSNKGTGTQSGNELTSTLAPEMKVSFNTQEKMPWNTKKRYESLMMSRIKPSLTHINSKSAVEVIGVSMKPHFHHPSAKTVFNYEHFKFPKCFSFEPSVKSGAKS